VDGLTKPARHHEPAPYSTRRYGCWATCTCGRWQSRAWTTVSGAHLEYGLHLLRENRDQSS
jgi:hypothetical protein